MSRTTKRFLSILLAAAMILSLGITGWAVDDIEIADPAKTAEKQETRVTAGFEGGTELEMEEIDPSTLKVPKLGEIKEDENAIDSEDLPFGPDDIVRVSIVLDGLSTLDAGYETQNIASNRRAMDYRHSLRAQQASVEAKIASAGVDMEVIWNLTLVVNIISAEVRYGDIEIIEAIPGVKTVFLENRYEPQRDELNTVITTEYMVGAAAVWADGYTGAGSRVAIVDTGTDQDHQSFDPEALEFALDEDGGEYNLLTWEEIEAVKDELNANTHMNSAGLTEEVYKNTKIPYAYNYVDGGYTTDHMSDTQEEHGSHVSGIAAANRYIKKDGEFVEAATEVFAVGVAPDAQILTMKVFGKGGGASDSDYMAAIEDAIILNADAVNLSLGSGSPGFTFSNGYQNVMDSLINSGTVVSMSAGNAYNWANAIPNDWPYLYIEDVSLATNGSPGSFANSLAVAAAANIGTVGTPLQFAGYDKAVFFSESSGYSNAPIASIPGEYDYVLLTGPGVDDNDHVGQEGDSFFALGEDVIKGKVALCMRGDSSFFAKANAAAAQGAAAVIIINNTSGVINMNLSGYSYTAPCVSILLADGRAILSASTPVTDEESGITYYTGKVTINDQLSASLNADRSEATITDFSSWGVSGSLILKPEIVAPGGDIYSVFGNNISATTGEHLGGSDKYESMSGTSMAAPHITGMAALLGQYIRENNLEELTGLNRRALINSLLMSTATPMMDPYGDYYPVLQQGAGLGDTYAASQAKSYILMGEDATASAADGKVKAEFGQDAQRTGEYSYSFSVNNFSEEDLNYALSTDLFTQSVIVAEMYAAYGYDFGSDRMDRSTLAFEEGTDFTVTYNYMVPAPNEHDVNKDGHTDKDDVQAILDYVSGKIEEEGLDLAAGDMDEDEMASSYDAELLLQWLEEEVEYPEGLFVPAGESIIVSVDIKLADDLKEFLDYYYPNGAYIEGYTYVQSVSSTDEGEILDVAHSIPLLGFYGSWTEPSMYDCIDPISVAYGNEKQGYTGNEQTNYLTVNYGTGDSIYMGNPYAVEEEFPADRLAINGNTALVNFKYNLIRNAATTTWLALDDSGDLIENGPIAKNVYGAYYYVNGSQWREVATKNTPINTNAAKLGLKEGDSFTIGMFAVPEYYGMLLHPGQNVNTVTPEEIAELRAAGELGEGSCIGYTLTVDNTAPTITGVTLSEDKTQITVKAKDDSYLAYVAIVNVLGDQVFVGAVPEQTAPGEEVEITFDISGLGLEGAVAAFAGDYAANEDASLVRISGEGPVPVVIKESHDIYIPATKLESGREYIIVSADTTGTVKALESRYGTGYYLLNSNVTVQEGTLGDYTGRYIAVDGVIDGVRWLASGAGSGFSLQCVADGAFIYPTSDGARPAGMTDATPWNYSGNTLNCINYYTVDIWISWVTNNFICNFSQPTTSCYIYVKDQYTTEETIEIDPENASEVTVFPDDLLMIAGDTAELSASVKPLVLPDKSVTWSSADETVATVDENGVVTAVGAGETEIIAASKVTPDVTGSAHVKVLAPVPMEGTLYGQVAFGDNDVEFVSIDLSDMSTVNLSGDEVFSYFYGGARSGDFIYGNDIDRDFHRYVVEDYSYDGSWHDVYEVIDEPFAMLDGASIPNFTFLNLDDQDEEGNPAEVDFLCNVMGVSSGGYFLFYDEGGQDTLSGFRVGSLANFVAVTFAGLTTSGDSPLGLYYYLLADDGTLFVFLVEPEIDEDGLANYGLKYGTIGKVEGLPMGGENTDYSMAYSAGINGVDGVFIADNTIGGIYYVDLEADTIEAQFVGLIDGATNVSTLYDNLYDAAGYIGALEVGGDEGGDDGNGIGDAFLASAFVRSIPLSGSLSIERFSDAVTEQIILPELDDGADDIIVVGGLDSVRTTASRRGELFNKSEWTNPEAEEDVVIAVDASKETFNGLFAVAYDPEIMEFVSADVKAEMFSVCEDTEKGVITIAFAGLEPIAEGELIAELHFTKPSEDTELTVTTLETNDSLEENDEEIIPITAPIKGFKVIVEDKTGAKATTSVDAEALYSGEVSFTIETENDQAALIALKDAEGNYTKVEITTAEGVHSFTLTVTEETTIAVLFKGDVTLDGKVESRDGNMVSRASVGRYTITDPLALLAADVDGNGKIESRDGNMISRAAVNRYTIPW